MAKLSGITFDCEDPARLATFWALALDGHTTDQTGEVVTSETGAHLYFQKVPEGKAVKNRVHLDMSSDNREAEVFRLSRNGARAVQEVDEGGNRWTVMVDPEGNEFCVSQA